MHPDPRPDDFRPLLRELVAQYGGTKQDLARAVDITPSSLSHLLAADAPSVPSTELCLRLAKVTGTSASKVLRAAGKSAIAELLEDLYGAAAERRQPFLGVRLTPLEAHHLATLRTLDPKTQRALYVIVESAAGGAEGGTSATPLPFKDTTGT